MALRKPQPAADPRPAATGGTTGTHGGGDSPIFREDTATQAAKAAAARAEHSLEVYGQQLRGFGAGARQAASAIEVYANAGLNGQPIDKSIPERAKEIAAQIRALGTELDALHKDYVRKHDGDRDRTIHAPRTAEKNADYGAMRGDA